MIKEYKLVVPVTVGEETIDVLKLESPSRKRIKQCPFNLGKIIDEKDIIEVGNLVESCAMNATSAHIDMVKAADLMEAGAVCMGFFTTE